MTNQQIKKPATTGECAMFRAMQGGKISAIQGNSSRGNGWRPVCRGNYLGKDIFDSEQTAIVGGKRFMADLKTRVEAAEKMQEQQNQEAAKAIVVAKQAAAKPKIVRITRSHGTAYTARIAGKNATCSYSAEVAAKDVCAKAWPGVEVTFTDVTGPEEKAKQVLLYQVNGLKE